MSRTLRLIVLLSLVSSAWAQLDTESIPPELDQRDLYARAAESRLAIIGTVVSSEGVLPRRLPGQSDRWHSNAGKDRRASLYIVRLEETVCRQSDFENGAPESAEESQPFYLFIPFDESDLPNGDFREEILPGQRYLLLLHLLDSHLLNAEYELDPNRTYYRGQGHNRGVIPLEPQTAAGRSHAPPEVVEKFRKLCSAMRPPKPEDKLALLQQLADSGDPVLQKEAENAINAVKAKMVPEQSPKAQPR